MTSLKMPPKQLSQKIMEDTKEQYRFYIFTRLELRDSLKKIHKDLQAVYGANCVSYSTMYKWIQAFQSENSAVKFSGSRKSCIDFQNFQNNIQIISKYYFFTR